MNKVNRVDVFFEKNKEATIAFTRRDEVRYYRCDRKAISRLVRVIRNQYMTTSVYPDGWAVYR